MHGLKSGSCRFWQRTDLPSGSNMLRAKIQRALRRAPRQLRRLRLGLQTRRGSNHSTAHVSESNSRSNVFISVTHPFAYPAVGKFSRASSAGGRRRLQRKLANQIVSVAEDCLSPERTFHGSPLMQFRGSIPLLESNRCTSTFNKSTHG